MNLVIENTLYSLLIYMLLKEEWRESYYLLLKTTIPVEIIEKMKRKNLKVEVSELGSGTNKKNKIEWLLKHYKNLFEVYNISKKIKKENKILKIYGNNSLYMSLYFREFDFYCLEDGIVNYTFNNYENFKEKLKKVILLVYKKNKGFAIEKKIKKIYLTGLASIPKDISYKVELINLKELWNKKTLEEQNDILDIFSFDLNIKEKIKGRSIILFTQPLSEDRIITEEEKIQIYSKIIKKYPSNRLIIKTHPREKTNYKKIFKEYFILDNPFPFEILNLLDIKFNKAITLFSTAALGLGKEVKVDFYGTEVHTKILERFGSCDDTMKRNCFLEEEY